MKELVHSEVGRDKFLNLLPNEQSRNEAISVLKALPKMKIEAKYFIEGIVPEGEEEPTNKIVTSPHLLDITTISLKMID